MIPRRSNVARADSPDPVLVSYSGSDAATPAGSYIVCLNGQVPETYEVWPLTRTEFAKSTRPLESNCSLFLMKTLSGALSMIPEDSVLLSSDVKASTAVSSFSITRTSLRTVVVTLFPLKISSFIPGVNIRL